MDNYEKKYKEALEIARIYHDNAKAVDDSSAERYENIFPELRGSEEEKLISEIINTVTGYHPVHTTQEINKMVEWLREQKEYRETLCKKCIHLKECKIKPKTQETLVACSAFENEVMKRAKWKPSYEQLDALRRAVDKLAKTDVADSVRLSIMYDHLKEKDKK